MEFLCKVAERRKIHVFSYQGINAAIRSLFSLKKRRDVLFDLLTGYLVHFYELHG